MAQLPAPRQAIKECWRYWRGRPVPDVERIPFRAIVFKEREMRLTCAAIMMIGLPAVVAAQSSMPAPGAFGRLPLIGLPLPPIGLPLPPMGLPPAIDTHARITGGHPSRAPESQHPRFGSRRSFRSAPTVVYLVPLYGWGHYDPAPTATPTASLPNASSRDRRQEPLTGTLGLEVQPRGVLQVYVDSYYVGTPDDFNGELELEAGPHRIEIRAPGYETLAFNVTIAPHRSIIYRGALKPADAKPEPDPTVREKPDTTTVAPQLVTPATPSTFYVIPGCYAGNVAPKDVALPVTCDLSLLVTYRP